MKRIVIQKLVWEDWNITHIARHNVTPTEVEEACKSKAQHEEADKGRIRATGITQKGRMLSIFLDPEPEPGVYYPVTARPASKKERKDYQEWLEGGEKAA